MRACKVLPAHTTPLFCSNQASLYGVRVTPGFVSPSLFPLVTLTNAPPVSPSSLPATQMCLSSSPFNPSPQRITTLIREMERTKEFHLSVCSKSLFDPACLFLLPFCTAIMSLFPFPPCSHEWKRRFVSSGPSSRALCPRQPFVTEIMREDWSEEEEKEIPAATAERGSQVSSR